ncbi:MAG: hypothetical protein WKF88_09385 [Ferruginibacter sp.]
MQPFLQKILLLTFILLCFNTAFAQQKNATADTLKFKTVSAGPQYKRSGFYQWLWGRNYRKEWIEPVQFPVLFLDTLKGGLLSYKEGGSKQSKALHLKTAGDKEYTLRSVDKSLDKVIPKIFQNTFLADIVNDQVSMSHPYGALGVPGLAKAIKVRHTMPKYYYLPAQPALDSLNSKYAGAVYLFEQRPKGNWAEADNFGNFSDFDDTDDMLKKILKNNDHSVDQPAFVRARLLDMLIADFDRHADQWKWGVKKEGNKTIYVPIPTDRDQAYFKHNGVLLNTVIAVSGMKFLQSYDNKIKDVEAYAYVNRILDRPLTNKMRLPEWEAIAADIQLLMTDSVIEEAIQQMPPEIYAIRGKDLIEKMKSRRSKLPGYAKEYYLLMAKEAEVIGTKGSEYFELNHLPNDEFILNIYPIQSGVKQAEPFYSRVFSGNETKELRLYGISGNDVFKITGDPNKKTDLRIIGGDQRDSVINEVGPGENKLYVYDNRNNYFNKNSNTVFRLSADSAVHEYNYNSFKADKKGFSPHIGYNDADRIYLGIRYTVLDYKWRRLPFASKHTFDVDYSPLQNAFSGTYTGVFPKLLGKKWDLLTKANYDRVRWINFYGLGNETPNITDDRNFYRLRTEEASANVGVSRFIGNSNINISGFYQMVKIIKDDERFVAKSLSPVLPGIYERDNYAGVNVAYSLADVKDSVLPQKGITFSLNARHTQNFKENDKSFQTYSGLLQFFIPLSRKFSFAVKNGATTMSGTPEFYQYPSLGETYNLRGFRRERFSGKTTYFNNVEFRFIDKVKTYLFNGKGGLMAFVDNGRVWLPGEKSNQFHTTYGGGILLAPFNLVSAAITYGISKEEKMLQFRLGILF